MKKNQVVEVENFGSVSKYQNYNPLEIHELDKRISELEFKINPTAKKIVSTLSQQMLLLHHLGILEKLNELNVSQKKQAELLSFLLNASKDNIKKDLSIIQNPKSPLMTETNYKVINKVFTDAGIEKLKVETIKILDKLSKSK